MMQSGSHFKSQKNQLTNFMEMLHYPFIGGNSDSLIWKIGNTVKTRFISTNQQLDKRLFKFTRWWRQNELPQCVAMLRCLSADTKQLSETTRCRDMEATYRTYESVISEICCGWPHEGLKKFCPVYVLSVQWNTKSRTSSLSLTSKTIKIVVTIFS